MKKYLFFSVWLLLSGALLHGQDTIHQNQIGNDGVLVRTTLAISKIGIDTLYGAEKFKGSEHLLNDFLAGKAVKIQQGSILMFDVKTFTEKRWFWVPILHGSHISYSVASNTIPVSIGLICSMVLLMLIGFFLGFAVKKMGLLLKIIAPAAVIVLFLGAIFLVRLSPGISTSPEIPFIQKYGWDMVITFLIIVGFLISQLIPSRSKKESSESIAKS